MQTREENRDQKDRKRLIRTEIQTRSGSQPLTRANCLLGKAILVNIAAAAQEHVPFVSQILANLNELRLSGTSVDVALDLTYEPTDTTLQFPDGLRVSHTTYP